MKWGFSGTQAGMTFDQKVWLEHKSELERGDEFHHGDCEGADAEAHAIALHLGLRITIHPPTNDKKRAFCQGWHRMARPYPYLVRNRRIVEAVTKLIAMPKGYEEELRSGTWATVRFALRRKLHVTVVWPDGKASPQYGASFSAADPERGVTRKEAAEALKERWGLGKTGPKGKM